MLGAEL